MRFWLREVAGWVLLVLGLYLFYLCYRRVGDAHWIVEGWVLALVGIILFRGGIHLLKIAVAARVCLEAEDRPELGQPVAAPGPASARGPAQTLPGRRSGSRQ
jgi:hypothetical protein